MLHKAAQSTHPPLLSILPSLCERMKRSKRGLNSRDKSSLTPMMHCRSREAALTLMSFGADPTSPNAEGRDAIALATGRGDLEVLRALLFSNCRVMPPRSPPAPKRCPLVEAVLNRQAKCISPLLEYGVDVNHCSHYDVGRSALMLAVQLEDEASVAALLQHSPSLTIHDSIFNSAAVYACLGPLSILEMLVLYDTKAFKMPTVSNKTVIEAALQFVYTESEGQLRSKYLTNLIASVPAMVSIGVPVTRAFLEELSAVHSSTTKPSRPFSVFSLSDIESARLYRGFESTPCDVHFVLAEKQSSWCHQTILRTMSEYFRRMDDLAGKPLVICIDDCSLDDFSVVKRFVYTNSLLYRRDYSSVLKIARKFEITRLAHLCESNGAHSPIVHWQSVSHLSSSVFEPKYEFLGNACTQSIGTLPLISAPVALERNISVSSRELQVLTRKTAMAEGPHDVVLRCEESELPVNSFFVNEGKFAAMIHFHRSLNKQKWGEPLLIDIVDMTFAQLEDVVSFLYLGQIQSIDSKCCYPDDSCLDYILGLYDISVYYLIDDLRRFCELVLPRLVGKDIKSAYQVFQRAIAFNNEQLAIDSIHKCLLGRRHSRGSSSILENRHMIEEMLRFLMISME